MRQSVRVHMVIDDLAGTEIAEFLSGHLADMRAQSPPESTHALDLDGLRGPAVTVWTVRDDDGTLLGCGALKELGPDGGEIKSMRTAPAARGRGVAAGLLVHLIGVARGRGYRTLHLETGSMEFFAPARRLYARHGFTPCPPFADYPDDSNSVHMVLELDPSRSAGRV
ncbi:Histone acetyltransferase HPA2 [Pseudonocardia sp. Ae263_Ps1]|uniref:GNAT family N-acetyltransferase n=2 Tax=Pseudonocardia TaxID=1847 RepID=UPI000962E585|nr:GNAT family N-acetyltransferase [Pseudonocardia sp. Ae150A_Ps1]OLL87922.1 Histone acetyltransferase HPA2 [Pseudonocardia sp. Ae263_Ps1]OLL92053.1 Histone acetyltransferase HPA2 [Pseudonocardia sp. Ae356_Ps1]